MKKAMILAAACAACVAGGVLAGTITVGSIIQADGATNVPGTGMIDGTLASTVVSGAAAGATATQPADLAAYLPLAGGTLAETAAVGWTNSTAGIAAGNLKSNDTVMVNWMSRLLTGGLGGSSLAWGLGDLGQYVWVESLCDAGGDQVLNPEGRALVGTYGDALLWDKTYDAKACIRIPWYVLDENDIPALYVTGRSLIGTNGETVACWQTGALAGNGGGLTNVTAGGLDPSGADGIRLAAAVVTPNGVGTNLTIAGLTIPYGSTQYYPGPLAASTTVTVSRASNSNLEVRVGSGSTCGITLGTAGLAICPATTPQGTLDLSDFDFGASTPRKVTIGNSTGSSAMFIGQSSTRFGSWSWSYNATPANAAMSFGTASYGNPIKFNGSAIVFQGDNTSGNVGFGTASPAEKLHVIGSGIISSNLTVGAALTVTGNITTAGDVYLGPSIGGSRAMLRTDGTNLFYITAGGGITNALTSNP